MISRRKAMQLMGSSNVPKERIMAICNKQKKMDPVEYFARAVITEREHGAIGSEIGTDVVGKDDKLAAKIALAHLLGVEFGHKPSEWEPCPYYYHELWAMEKRCQGPPKKKKKKPLSTTNSRRK